MSYKWIEKELKEIKKMEGRKPSKKMQTRTKKYVKQYERQGWTDIDTWNLDIAFIEWVTPRLKRFIELNNGYPGNIDGMNEDTWDEILKKIYDGFNLYKEKGLDLNVDEKKQIQESFTLFGKWAFEHMWW